MRVTAKGADVEMHTKNKTMTFSKKQLVLVDTSIEPNPMLEDETFPTATAATGDAPPLGSHPFGARGLGPQSQPHAQNVASPPSTIVPHSGFVAPRLKALPPQVPTQSLPNRPSGEPKVYSIARPLPNYVYMAAAYAAPSVLEISRPLLVILDLNGTLLYRKNKGTNFKPRPHLNEFLEYLFSNHIVMVWSSARPYNVMGMCKQFFSPEQYQRVAAIWTRDHLHLTPEAYKSNTQVYKQLSWVWRDARIQAANPLPNTYWGQSNTVLLDDSVEKSASEPYNLIRIEEFEDRADQAGEDVLPQVALYLNTLRSQRDACAYIRSQPFVVDPSMPRAAAEAFAVARHAAMSQSQYLAS